MSIAFTMPVLEGRILGDEAHDGIDVYLAAGPRTHGGLEVVGVGIDYQIDAQDSEQVCPSLLVRFYGLEGGRMKGVQAKDLMDRDAAGLLVLALAQDDLGPQSVGLADVLCLHDPEVRDALLGRYVTGDYPADTSRTTSGGVLIRLVGTPEPAARTPL